MKKTLIITERQLSEICGPNFNYFDGLALNPDLPGDKFSDEITADGKVEQGYPEPTRTDTYAADMTNDWRGNAKLHGMGPITVREMTKKDFEKAILEAHGNKRLNNRTFGENNRSYNAIGVAKNKFKKASQMAQSQDPKTREKGLKTLRNMDTTGIRERDAAMNFDKILQDMKPEGEKIVSGPKESGNGKAHSVKTPDGGIIHN